MIKVPLGKGATQQLEERQKPVTLSNDIEFLRELMVKRRMVIENVNSQAAQDAITIIPQTGTTFFFLKLVATNIDTVDAQIVSLTNNSSARGSPLEALALPALTSGRTNAPIDMVVGNSSDTFVVSTNSDAATEITLFGWNENTPRIA